MTQPIAATLPWLPKDALIPAHFEQAISRLLEEWSSHWFGKAKATGRVRLREVSAVGAPVLHWRSWGGDCGIGIDEAGRLMLGEAMLGRPIPANAVLPPDRPLLEDMTDKCLEDLGRRVSWLIDRDRSPELSPDPAFQSTGMIWDIGLRRSGVGVSLVIGRSALVRWRKSLAPKSQPAKLAGIFMGLKNQPVALGLSLGQGSLKLADLENLGKGDVVILDSIIDRPLGLVSAGRRTGFRVKLTETGEGAALEIIEKKKVAS